MWILLGTEVDTHQATPFIDSHLFGFALSDIIVPGRVGNGSTVLLYFHRIFISFSSYLSRIVNKKQGINVIYWPVSHFSLPLRLFNMLSWVIGVMYITPLPDPCHSGGVLSVDILEIRPKGLTYYGHVSPWVYTGMLGASVSRISTGFRLSVCYKF